MKVKMNTLWRAYFKRGGGEALVYGESAEEATKNALAAYRKSKTMVDMLSIDDVVDHVDFIG